VVHHVVSDNALVLEDVDDKDDWMRISGLMDC
jgi:CTP:molybdopterin cytidylyltransferase MocA